MNITINFTKSGYMTHLTSWNEGDILVFFHLASILLFDLLLMRAKPATTKSTERYVDLNGCVQMREGAAN